MLSSEVSRPLDVSLLGPAKAAERLGSLLTTEEQKREWACEARIQAIVGRCPKSKEKVGSGLRCWHEFYGNLPVNERGPFLPPRAVDLLAWSTTFRCDKTFSNYVGYIKLACELIDAPLASFDHPSLPGAARAIKKRRLFVPRKPMFVRFDSIQKMA